ncbi:hypothetical protein FACS189442_4740 [Spirochaetia bacterium]|nr:hypothetical protein FACS189442_4740 [Spirochaetia bacterium]
MVLYCSFLEHKDARINITNSIIAFDFLDADIEKQYRLTGAVPTARDIATMFDVLEQSASRTINNFFKKVEAKC